MTQKNVKTFLDNADTFTPMQNLRRVSFGLKNYLCNRSSKNLGSNNYTTLKPYEALQILNESFTYDSLNYSEKLAYIELKTVLLYNLKIFDQAGDHKKILLNQLKNHNTFAFSNKNKDLSNIDSLDNDGLKRYLLNKMDLSIYYNNTITR